MGTLRSEMALNPAEGVHEVGVVDTDALYAVGASGALTATYAKGVRSATRNGEGDYTFILDALYVSGLRAVATVNGTFTRTDGVRTICTFGTDSTTGRTKVDVLVYPDDGTSTTKTDIKSGNTLSLTLRLKAVAG